MYLRHVCSYRGNVSAIHVPMCSLLPIKDAHTFVVLVLFASQFFVDCTEIYIPISLKVALSALGQS